MIYWYVSRKKERKKESRACEEVARIKIVFTSRNRNKTTKALCCCLFGWPSLTVKARSSRCDWRWREAETGFWLGFFGGFIAHAGGKGGFCP
jgi:hypothetical protein